MRVDWTQAGLLRRRPPLIDQSLHLSPPQWRAGHRRTHRQPPHPHPRWANTPQHVNCFNWLNRVYLVRRIREAKFYLWSNDDLELNVQKLWTKAWKIGEHHTILCNIIIIIILIVLERVDCNGHFVPIPRDDNHFHQRVSNENEIIVNALDYVQKNGKLLKIHPNFLKKLSSPRS